jgi:hypothetical protein
MSLSPSAHGVKIRLHSALDPSLSRLSGAPRKPFTPTLQSALPYGSTLFYDVSGLNRIAPRVLGAGSAAGIGGQVEPLLRRLGGALAAEGVDVRALLSIFDGETAIAVTPGTGTGSPSLIIVTRTKNVAQSRAALAALQVPLAELFPAPGTGPGQAPVFNDIHLDGVTAHQLALTPGLQLDYAVFNGLVVVSTSRSGIAAVAEHKRSIAQEPQFGAAPSRRPDQVSSLLFLDFNQLLTLGEQTGLTRGALDALMPDLQRIRAVGMSSASGESDTTTELYVQIP